MTDEQWLAIAAAAKEQKQWGGSLRVRVNDELRNGEIVLGALEVELNLREFADLHRRLSLEADLRFPV